MENRPLKTPANAIRPVDGGSPEENPCANAGRAPSYFVQTFGCQQNEADSEKLRGMLEDMGYLPAAAAEEADVILVNTCAVREHAENRALSYIGSFKKWKEQDRRRILGVCGCMAARPERIAVLQKSYPYVNFTLRPGDLELLPTLMQNALAGGKRQFPPEREGAPIPEGIPTRRQFAHKAPVTVMYGCNNFCSYCIVPHVRGRERSRPWEAVVEEVRSLVQAGCRDIMLLGQNVNSYAGGCDFADLLYRLDAIEGDHVLRFMSSHPKDVPDKLIRAFGECRHVESHFHLPVQSGSDRVLREMNRRYGREAYFDILRRLRQARPDAVLTSDIMVGFPGETEEDFADTLDLLAKARFDMVYSFLYSPREGTPAAARPDQVPEEVKHARFERLLALQDGISLEKNLDMVGKTYRVLLDSEDAPGRYSGRTDGGKLVHTNGREGLVGSFVQVTVTRAEPYAVIGDITK